MDWRALLTNRWALGGVAVAAAAGGYVLYRKKQTGSGTGSSGTGAQASPTYSAGGAVGSFDSTGTDVANWLGQYSGNLDNQFKEFQKNVADQLAAIPTSTATGTGTTTTANNPAPTAASLPGSLLVPANVNLYDYSQQIEQQYGLTTPLINRLTATGQVRWGQDLGSGYGKMPYFATPTTVSLG